MKTHAAPWSKLLMGTSLFASLICIGVSIMMWTQVGRTATGNPVGWVAALPLAVVAISALLVIRGYAVTADEILIQRSFWNTRFARNQLQSATADPGALRGSIRIFGNGGLFSFTGLFRSRALGRYRAYVTDPARTVILRFNDRVVVVSPADPEAFVRDVATNR